MFLVITVIVLFITALSAAIGFIASFLQIVGEINSRRRPTERQRFTLQISLITLALTIVFMLIGINALPKTDTSSPQTSGSSHMGVVTTVPRDTSTSSPTPTQIPSPTATPSPTPGTILYQSDFAHRANEWIPNQVWSVSGGMFLCSGSTSYTNERFVIPYQPTIANYSLEVRFRYKFSGSFEQAFGFSVRDDVSNPANLKGYVGGMDGGAGFNPTPYAFIETDGFHKGSTTLTKPFDSGGDWATFRIEVHDTTIKLFINDVLALRTDDTQSAGPYQAAIWDNDPQLWMSSVKITAL